MSKVRRVIFSIFLFVAAPLSSYAKQPSQAEIDASVNQLVAAISSACDEISLKYGESKKKCINKAGEIAIACSKNSAGQDSGTCFINGLRRYESSLQRSMN